MHGETAERDAHDFIERHELMEAPLSREVVEWRNQHGGLDGAALQRGEACCAAADLEKRHVLFRIHAVLAQNHDRFTVRRAAKTADAEVFALEVFDPFHIRTRHQVVIRAIHSRHHDADRQAGDRCTDEIRERAAVVDVAGNDAVYDDLVLHDHNDGVDAFAFEKPLLFGDDER